MPKTKPTSTPVLLDPEMIPSSTSTASPRAKMSYLPWVLVVIVVLLALGFFYNQSQKSAQLQAQLEEIKNNPQKIAEDETKVLLEKVGLLVELPDEQPTIATVTDLAPLQDQPFFARAEVGDKVLIFSQAEKAILYRPSTNKVIEIAPVDLNAPSANVNTTESNNRSTSSTNRSTNSGGTTNTNTDSTKTNINNTD